MRKLLALSSILVILLFSCNSDDSGNSSNSDDLFLKINVSNTEYNTSGLFATGYSGEENCDNNGDLFLQYVGQIENSELFIDCSFVHFENTIDFNDDNKNIITNTRVTDINDLWELNTGVDACSLNNDFSIIYENKLTNEFLELKNEAIKTHNITRLEFVSEDSQGEQYIIEGNFSATFNDDSVDIPVNGSYRTKIDVLK